MMVITLTSCQSERSGERESPDARSPTYPLEKTDERSREQSSAARRPGGEPKAKVTRQFVRWFRAPCPYTTFFSLPAFRLHFFLPSTSPTLAPFCFSPGARFDVQPRYYRLFRGYITCAYLCVRVRFYFKI